jgi:hypothetical protein
LGRFLDLSCTGRLSGLPGIPPFVAPGSTRLVCAAAKRFPECRTSIVKIYKKYTFPIIDLPLFLMPLQTVARTPGVREDLVRSVAAMAAAGLARCEIEDGFSAAAAFETLRVCWDVKPGIAENIGEIIEFSMMWLTEAKLMKQDNADMDMFFEIVPPIVKFIMAVYARPVGVLINTEVFKRALYFLPYPPEVKGNEGILKDALRILNNEKLDRFWNRICAIIMEMVVLSDEDLQTFKFAPETITAMKEGIREKLVGNPVRTKKVLKKLQNAKRDKLQIDELLAEQISLSDH